MVDPARPRRKTKNFKISCDHKDDFKEWSSEKEIFLTYKVTSNNSKEFTAPLREMGVQM